MFANAYIEDPASVLDALMKSYFPAFLAKAFEELNGKPIKWNWHLDAIAYQLDLVHSGKINQLLVTLPPRNLKSIAISVAWVAFELGRDPTLQFTCLSYSSQLALDLARKTRKIMMSPWYRHLFPGTIITRSAAQDIETTRGGRRFATSITGTMTGFGGHYIIIDDPIKADEALSDTVRNSVGTWYSQTLSSRLDDKVAGALICVMQRLHEDDLAGQMLREGGWTHLNLPGQATEDHIVPLTRGRFHVRRTDDVLHPEREPLSVLEKMKAKMGAQAYSAQVQQQPIPATGSMCEAAWLQRYDQVPERTGRTRLIQSWDTATKDGIDNDWTVCVTALECDRRVFILTVFRAKLTAPGVLRAIVEQARLHKPDAILIEDAASGAMILQILSEHLPRGVAPAIACKPIDDKKTRFGPAQIMIEAGLLYLPRNAAWLGAFEHELLGFPNARHDDQVDAISQLMSWLSRRHFEIVAPEGPILMYMDDYGNVISSDGSNPTDYQKYGNIDPWSGIDLPD